MARQRAGVEGNTGGYRKTIRTGGKLKEQIGKSRRTPDQIPGNDNRSTNDGSELFTMREVRSTRGANKPYRVNPKPKAKAKPKPKKKLPNTR